MNDELFPDREEAAMAVEILLHIDNPTGSLGGPVGDDQ